MGSWIKASYLNLMPIRCRQYCLYACLGMCFHTVAIQSVSARVDWSDQQNERNGNPNLHYQSWVDAQYIEVQDWLQDHARIVDDWIGETDPNTPAQAGIRVIVDTAWSLQNGTTVIPDVRGHIKLPALENRLSVIVGDEFLAGRFDQNEPNHQNKIETKTTSRSKIHTNRTSLYNASTSLALRWSQFRQEMGIDVDLGIKAQDIFIQAKADKTWSIADNATVYAKQIHRYGALSGHTASTTLQLTQKKSVSDYVIGLLDVRHTYKNRPKFVFSSRLFHQHRRQVAHGKSRMNIGLYASGEIKDGHITVKTYGPYISYRQPVGRPWLLLQTDISYYHKPASSNHPQPSVFGRMEMVF